jgi:hypothetical protein
MAHSGENLAASLAELAAAVGALRLPQGAIAAAAQRWHTDAAAALFHLRDRHEHPPMVAVLGGTGTGKSTLINRLLGAELCAASFRRTYTSGPIAVTSATTAIPPNWLGLPHELANELPARGRPLRLCIVTTAAAAGLLARINLVDTPDLDGDEPAHHAEADRVFRWAQALVFLVTPEKYQMTELFPYYRLARRYALPAAFVMNKCQEQGALDDYAAQLAERHWPGAAVFAVPRDDAAYEPPPGAGLSALAQTLAELPRHISSQANAAPRAEALRLRVADLLGRLRDQVLAPLRHRRLWIQRTKLALQAMTAPQAAVDVSPLTRQLQHRLQEQSILYLMGPQRMLQRVRQVPGLLLRLPRTAWDLLMHGQGVRLDPPAADAKPAPAPDFAAILADQFTVLHSRIDDLIASPEGGAAPPTREGESEQNADMGWRAVMLPPAAAANIAHEELAELTRWLEQRWHSAPRDTAALRRLLRHLPGGESLVKWSEAAPYLLAVVVAAHGAVFGPVDLLIIGGFSLATWLGEKLSNEVTARTRQANERIARRYARLVQDQIERVCAWLEEQAPSEQDLLRIETMADRLGG